MNPVLQPKPHVALCNNNCRNKAEMRFQNGKQTVVQPKMELTTPGDTYEQEADRMADFVMRKSSSGLGSEQPSTTSIFPPTISRNSSSSGGVTVGASTESGINASRGSGQPMPSTLLTQMESGFGQDFSAVRLHTGSNAMQMNRDLGAKAFTYGNDIYFNSGQYQPHSHQGLRLLAHELTHVVQQNGKVGRQEASGAITENIIIDEPFTINPNLIDIEDIMIPMIEEKLRYRIKPEVKSKLIIFLHHYMYGEHSLFSTPGRVLYLQLSPYFNDNEATIILEIVSNKTAFNNEIKKVRTEESNERKRLSIEHKPVIERYNNYINSEPELRSNPLTTAEALLLNILTYLPFKQREILNANLGITLSDLINILGSPYNTAKWENDEYISRDDWKNTLDSIKGNPILCDIIIKDCDGVDFGDGRGFSILFIQPYTKEAIIAYRGTSPKEWDDNVKGAKMESTNSQKIALNTYYKYYNTIDKGYYITLTGHSKGGNKAKYITIKNDSVDRCISFDGQGFSSQFIEGNIGQIKKNAHKISNHNADKDFVNILLYNLGFNEDITYYQAKNLTNPSFGENHSPEVMLTFIKVESENGEITIPILNKKVKIDKLSEQLDVFTDDFIDSINNMEYKNKELYNSFFEEIGAIVQNHFNKNDIEINEDNSSSFAYLIAYFLEYYENKDEFEKQINILLPELAGLIGGAIKFNYDFINKEILMKVNEETNIKFKNINIDDLAEKITEYRVKIQSIMTPFNEHELNFIMDMNGI